jgi:hypothetical protein
MKKVILGIALSCLSALSTHAADAANTNDTWLGNIRLVNEHRGSWGTYPYNGQAFSMNLCGYNSYSIYFDYYQSGVTDAPGTPVWQNISAQVQLVQDSTQNVIAQISIPVVGMNGNNAVYEIPVNVISFEPNGVIAPSVVTGLDPNSQNTHVVIYLDNKAVTSIPLQFSCENTG